MVCQRVVFCLLILLLPTLGSSVPVRAAEGGTVLSMQPKVKTAVVDILEVFNQSLAMQEWQVKFSKHVHEDQAFLGKIEQDLRNRELVMAKRIRHITQGTLSKEEKERQTNQLIAQRRQYEDEIAALQDFLLRRKEYLDGIFSEAKKRVQGMVTALVKEMAQERGFQLVLNRSQVVYAHPKGDLTALVIAQLNQKMPTLSLTVEPIATFKKNFEKEQKGIPHG